MTDKRLLYRVILKVLAMIGIIALLLVFFNATFYSNIETQEAVVDTEDVTVDLSHLFSGSNTVVRWNNKRVGILKRSDANQLALVKQTSTKPQAELHEINEHLWRSLDPRYFVYFDIGDSGHCPLFMQNNGGDISFKDTCTASWFDTQGRFISDGKPGLNIPPHHFSDDNQLTLGRWLAE